MVRGFLRFELFRQFPTKWFMCWVLAPNLPVIAMWFVGGPQMAGSIFLCGLIALLASQRRSPAIRIISVIAIYALTIAIYVTTSFNIGIANVLDAPQYVTELRPTDSPEYVAALLIMAASLGAAIYFRPRTPMVTSKGPVIMALGGIALLVNIDTVATAGTRGSYKASAPAGTPIDSAVLQTGIEPNRVTARNLVIVMVESWGVPANDADRMIDRAVWRPERWSERYEVSSGTSAYYGSTTNAEVRELCGFWADHNSFDFKSSHCLPEQFRAAGFATHALHSFDGDFFNRREWYPMIGFDDARFKDELIAAGAGSCEGVFPGACDVDIPREIGKLLKQSRQHRNLVYWLTVNSHLPVPSSKSLGTDTCRLGTIEWRQQFPMLCRSYRVHQRLADALTAEILDKEFPEADILIVGDHMPPFFPRSIRTRYDAAHVPYYFLRHRGALKESPEGTRAFAQAHRDALSSWSRRGGR